MPAYRVIRSTEINAPKDKILNALTDFKSWPSWSPWLIYEPDTKLEYNDRQQKVGAYYSWEGKLVGAGEMECLAINPNKIENEIRFTKPFKSKSGVSFDLEEKNGKTTVSWVMDGKLPWFMFFMVGMMEKWIGMDYERGLRMLKAYMEKGQVDSKVSFQENHSANGFHYVGMKGKGTIPEIGPMMQDHYCKLKELLDSKGIQPSGTPLAMYQSMSMKDQSFEFTSMIPVSSPVGAGGEFVEGEVPSFKALKVEHLGDYEFLGNAWSAAFAYKRFKKLKTTRKPMGYEVYVNDPTSTEPKDLVTDLLMPMR